MHRLLERQIRRYLAETGPLPAYLDAFINAVDRAYRENDADRIILERAFDLSSRELMQVNEELRKAFGRFESIIGNAPFVAIRGFDRQGTVLHWNRACEVIYGLIEADAKGRRFQDIVLPPYSVAEFEAAIEAIWKSRDATVPREWEVRNRAGEIRWIFSSMFPVLEGGDVVEVLCMDLDVTERKRLEAQLLQAQKLEAIGTLAGGLAHDFNNLLMGIHGYVQLMLMDLDSSHPHYEKLERIEMQVRSGADLSDRLLGFARGVKYEPKPIDLNEIIAESSDTFGRTKKEISVDVSLAPGLWTVEADKSQMEQVLLNLFVNAWQAMPGSGRLSISTENEVMDDVRASAFQFPAGKYVNITVADTGIGMDEKTRLRIFEPFFTTKGMGRGTGLGLATVYGIIKAHKGVITVYSEQNRGTTFHIYLPACEKEPVREKPRSEAIHRGKGCVLVVDDEEFILEVTREMLIRLGYTALTAKGGKVALDLYRAYHSSIDVIILDMIMPDISGDATFDGLIAINPAARVILASGYSSSADSAKRIIEKGAVSFIQKPYRLSELSNRLAKAMRRPKRG